MNKAEAAKVVALLKASWPNHPFTAESPIAYHMGLGDLPFAVVQEAIAKAMQTETFCPPPAVLRNMIGANNEDKGDPEGEWGKVVRAFSTVGYYRQPQFEDPATQKAVEIMGWQTLCQSPLDDEPANRKHFYDTYKAVRRQMSQNTTRALAGLAPVGTGQAKALVPG